MALKRIKTLNNTINIEGRKVYHGSDSEITNPEIISTGYTKDFGFGFYCTEIEKQAIRRANSKAKMKGTPIVNEYLIGNTTGLSVKIFEKMNDEWLDFIVKCRNGNSHSFDIVEGPMADDAIYDHVEDFVSGKITREAFWELAKFKFPTHQIAFCSKKSLNSLLFLKSKKYANKKINQITK